MRMNEAAEKNIKINYTQLAKDLGSASRNKELPGNCGQMSNYFTNHGDNSYLRNVVVQQ